MTADFLSIRYSEGNAFLNKEGPSELAWPLPWKKKEDSLESCSLMLVLDNMEGKK